MGRLRQVDENRPTTTTRLYQDTVRIVKLLAEAQDMTMADYLDGLVREAAKRDADKITAAIDAYTSGPAKPRKPGK